MMAAINSINSFCLKVLSFNMHGYHQGSPVVDDMITDYAPDILLLQEHWLMPANLYKFNDQFSDCLLYTSDAADE